MRRLISFVFICMTLLALNAAFEVDSAPTALSPATTVHAQDDDTCISMVTDALRTIGSACVGLGRNEVCYGNQQVSATFRDDTTQFEASGDIAELMAFETLFTQPADPDTGQWGVAVLSVQADLPEASDQNVTLVMVGGAELEPAAASRDMSDDVCSFTNTGTLGINMRLLPSIYGRAVDLLDPGDTVTVYAASENGEWLRSARGWIFGNLGALSDCVGTLPTITATDDLYAAPGQNLALTIDNSGACDAAPAALMIQAPAGQTANVMINGIEIRVGSTATITMNDDNTEMMISNMDHQVSITDGERGIALPEGTSAMAAHNGNSGEMELVTGLLPLDPKMRNMPDEFWSDAMPEGIDVPDYFAAPVDTTLAGNGNQNGDNGAAWGACGSCNDCGPYPDNECVSAPDGTCVWDPNTCRIEEGAAGVIALSDPLDCNLTGGQLTVYQNGAYTAADGTSWITNVSVSIADGTKTDLLTAPSFSLNSFSLEMECSDFGYSDVTVTITDSVGGVTSRTFQYKGY